MCHLAGDGDIKRLRDIGYGRFKCVRQNDFELITPGNLDAQIARRRAKARGGFVVGAARMWRRATRFTRHSRDGAWVFPSGSSGRLGPDLPGEWISADETLGIWKRLRDIDAELVNRRAGEWFDIHATA